MDKHTDTAAKIGDTVRLTSEMLAVNSQATHRVDVPAGTTGTVVDIKRTSDGSIAGFQVKLENGLFAYPWFDQIAIEESGS